MKSGLYLKDSLGLISRDFFPPPPIVIASACWRDSPSVSFSWVLHNEFLSFFFFFKPRWIKLLNGYFLLRSIGDLSNPKVENLCVQGGERINFGEPAKWPSLFDSARGLSARSKTRLSGQVLQMPGWMFLQTLYRASQRWSVSSRLVVLRLLLLKSCCKLCHREEAGWFVPLPKFSPSRRWLCTFCKWLFHRSSGGKALGFWEMETAEVYLSLTWAI